MSGTNMEISKISDINFMKNLIIQNTEKTFRFLLNIIFKST